MALTELTPATRIEEILAGEEISPATRLEYFMQKAANEVPKPDAGDAGLLLAVNSDADGYELVEPPAGGGVPVIDLTTVTPTSFRHLDNTLSILVSGVPEVVVGTLQANDVVAVKLPFAFYDDGAFDLDPADAFLTLVASWEYESDLRLKALNFFSDEQGNIQYGIYDFTFTH